MDNSYFQRSEVKRLTKDVRDKQICNAGANYLYTGTNVNINNFVLKILKASLVFFNLNSVTVYIDNFK